MKKLLLTFSLFLLLGRVVTAPPNNIIAIPIYTPITVISDAKYYLDSFTDDLRRAESPNWTAINSIGCMGWFQFTPATLRDLGYGYITPEAFKADSTIFLPNLQLKVFKLLLKRNEEQLHDYMKYVDTVINNVLITKSGLLAAAHLGGCGGVMDFINSEGKKNYKDLNGTRIQHYLTRFAGYDLKKTTP